jgi:hypothetical protein
MLSKETIEWYRQMSPSERLRLTLLSIRENQKFLDAGSPGFVARKYEVLRLKKDESNNALVRKLLEAEVRRHEQRH